MLLRYPNYTLHIALMGYLFGLHILVVQYILIINSIGEHKRQTPQIHGLLCREIEKQNEWVVSHDKKYHKHYLIAMNKKFKLLLKSKCWHYPQNLKYLFIIVTTLNWSVLFTETFELHQCFAAPHLHFKITHKLNEKYMILSPIFLFYLVSYIWLSFAPMNNNRKNIPDEGEKDIVSVLSFFFLFFFFL